MRKLVFIFLLFKIPAFAQLNADFSASVVKGCTPLVVQFTDLSTGNAASWFWDFGNGITSSLQNPAVTYTAGGNYSVRLIIKNAAGQDYEQKTNYITVFTTPKAGYLVLSGDSGCAPLQTSFSDISDFYGAPVKSWLWDFGDGGTSNQQNPSHTFTPVGKYDVSLTVETTQGCSSVVNKKAGVIAGNKPNANFLAAPLAGCASTIRSFKNKSLGNITASAWRFGDGGVSFDKDPQYHYQDTGVFSVKLRISENGCEDSITIPNYIHVDGPVAKFFKRINCDDRFTIRFYDTSLAETGRQWDFGDATTSSDVNPVHIYGSPGIYITKLMITGSICNDTARDTIHIKAANPVIQVSPVKNIYCKYDTLEFSVKNYDTADTKSFIWNFDDGISRGAKDVTTHVYESAGNFKPALYIRNNENCTDTINSNGNLVINGPTANFSATANGCTNSPVAFQDKSTAAGSQVTQWLWSYGDGTISTNNTPLNYSYPFPGIYKANLTVTDANGCIDTISHAINIFQSPTVDAGIDTFACAGSSVSLDATGATSYTWQNNNSLSCTQCANPVAKPLQPEVYYVTGTSNGCSSSDSVKIKVQTRQSLTAQPASYTICEGDFVNLNVSGTDKYSWLTDNTLSSTTIPNPVATPVANTVYTAIGKDSKNCFADTARINVTVNPTPKVTIADSAVEVLAGTNYTILASTGSDGAVTLEWSPPLGLSCFSCLQPTTTVNNTITYTLTATDAFGCRGSDSIILIALCDKKSIFIPNTFSPNNDGVNDNFYPRANGTVLIKSMTIFNRWGQVVFDKRNFYVNGAPNGWDGKYNNVQQRPDVYVYIIKLVCANNETFTQRGNISLIR
jgi:gliding motility-associated-like protein